VRIWATWGPEEQSYQTLYRHPDPIWKDGALGFFEERRPNKKNKIDSDMGSVPDPT